MEILTGVGHLHASVALEYARLVDLMRQAEAAGEDELAVSLLEALGAIHDCLLVPSP